MERLFIEIEALQSMHRFGDTLTEAIEGIESETAQFQVLRDAKDCIGRHWYGLRCQVNCRKTGIGFYLHIGLIYFPSTRPGLMIELDEQNNHGTYQRVKQQIAKRPEFEINRDEAEYFKLFMPDAVFEQMSGKSREEQVCILQDFVKNGAEAMVASVYQTGFTLNHKNMADSLNLVNAFDRVLQEIKSDFSAVKINYEDPDNFGQYAQGFRYFLTNHKALSLYAYFGAIYSYKKQPAGIFTEIDRFSNQEEFSRVYENMEESEAYEMGISEPGFIKLFLKEDMIQKLNEAEYDQQIEILKLFLKECNDQLVAAWEKGGSKNG